MARPAHRRVGWNDLKDVIAAGRNRFYGLTQDDKLMWYQHDGFNSGEFEWKGGTQVGNGWTFKRIFAGADGVIYAIRDDGKLFWYRHLGYRDGSNQWSEAKEVGSGWGEFNNVFSLGGGAVYAVQDDGTLLLYQQKGFETGTKDWHPARTVGSGWNQFQQIVPVGNGGHPGHSSRRRSDLVQTPGTEQRRRRLRAADRPVGHGRQHRIGLAALRKGVRDHAEHTGPGPLS